MSKILENCRKLLSKSVERIFYFFGNIFLSWAYNISRTADDKEINERNDVSTIIDMCRHITTKCSLIISYSTRYAGVVPADKVEESQKVPKASEEWKGESRKLSDEERGNVDKHRMMSTDV